MKDPGHSAKSAGSRLQLNRHAPYICGFAWSDMVHGCTVYTECAKMAAVLCDTSHGSPSVDIQKRSIKKKAVHSCTSTCKCIESAQEQRLALYKSDQQQQQKLKCFDTRFRNTMCLVHLQLWGNLSFVVFCCAVYFGRWQRTVNIYFVWKHNHGFGFVV